MARSHGLFGRHLWVGIPLLFAPATVLAHPPQAHDHDDAHAEGSSDTTITKQNVIRFKVQDKDGDTEVHAFEWMGDELTDALEAMTELLAEGELLDEMGETMTSLAARVEIETDSDGEAALIFDDKDMVRIQRKSDRKLDADDHLTISGLGRNLRIERETRIEDGKEKTRIVIEMDGGGDVDIDGPGNFDAPSPPAPPR